MLDLTFIDISLISLVLVLCITMLFSKDVVKIIAAFLGVLMVVAMLFLLANSGFLFITQLLLYIGGVSVLLVFVLMLTKRLTKEKNLVSETHNWISGLLIGGGLLAAMFICLDKQFVKKELVQINDVQGFGIGIVTSHLFAFELLAVFLLVALILAAVIAGKKSKA